jgi:hypothetical protein
VSQSSWKRSTKLRTVALAWLSVLEIRTMYAQQERDRTAQRQSIDLQSLQMIDFFNLFPNVGALVVWVEPNDAGVPEGLLTRCTGTLIDERVLLTAGHCVAWGGRRSSTVYQVLGDLQPECARPLDMARGLGVHRSSFTAAVPSAGLVHISRPRSGNSGHRPCVPS